MKKIMILGGIVILLMAVIKIGSLFMPSNKETEISQVTTQESSPSLETTLAREPITIEIENGEEETTAAAGDDSAELLPVIPDESEATETVGSAGQAVVSSTACSITSMEPKTMYAIKSVNIREGCSTDTEVVGGLSPGMGVKATGESKDGWIQISHDGMDAYVYKTYLSTNKDDVVKETTVAKPTTAKPTTPKPTASKPSESPPTVPVSPTTGAAADETIAPFPGN